MAPILTICHLTLHEAARRRILLASLICGLAFLVLFGIGFHFVVRDLPSQVGVDQIRRKMILSFFTQAGLYATNFLAVMTAVLLPVDTLSGEIASGTIQTVASKPIRRSQIVLGKWLGFVVIVGAYLALVAGGVLLIVRLRSGYLVPNIYVGLPLMFLESVLLVTLSIAGGTRFSTVTNGVLALGLYGLAFLGGWVEQIGTIAGNDTARTIGTVVSLMMPSESLWQLAAHNMQPPMMGALTISPFSPASVPTLAVVFWAAGYIVTVMALSLWRFSKRAL